MKIFLGLAFLGLAFHTAGCAPEGPAERAGAQIDETVDEARDTAEEIRDETQELANDITD